MEDTRYNLVQFHKRPDLQQQCFKLLNSVWKRSRSERFQAFEVSYDEFRTNLLLLNEKKLVGHCKVFLLNELPKSVVLKSVIIDHACRSQGHGSKLLQAVEDYVYDKGIRNVYLMTKGQEGFYSKNGYNVCECIELLYKYRDFDTYPDETIDEKFKLRENIAVKPLRVLKNPERTFILKKLQCIV